MMTLSRSRMTKVNSFPFPVSTGLFKKKKHPLICGYMYNICYLSDIDDDEIKREIHNVSVVKHITELLLKFLSY